MSRPVGKNGGAAGLEPPCPATHGRGMCHSRGCMLSLPAALQPQTPRLQGCRGCCKARAPSCVATKECTIELAHHPVPRHGAAREGAAWWRADRPPVHCPAEWERVGLPVSVCPKVGYSSACCSQAADNEGFALRGRGQTTPVPWNPTRSMSNGMGRGVTRADVPGGYAYDWAQKGRSQEELPLTGNVHQL